MPEPDCLPSEARAAVLEGLAAPFERKRTPAAYRLSLMLGSIVVIVLPLLYVALVGATGWGVYWYAVEGGRFFSDVSLGYWYLLGRFSPVVIGFVVFFFLLKPLLARAPDKPAPYSLDRAQQPFLFEFVRRLAACLDAPAPCRIDVDLSVNAAARLAAGFRSLYDGSFALTIGLPLTSTLRLRELCTVLAHELGHFSQGAGMRFYYLMVAVNRWFARVVFQRDEFDLWLEHASRENWWLTKLVLNLARAFTWLSRRILFLLLKVGAAASSLVSRQMEFDADQNAVRLCGTRSFVDSMALLPLVEVASTWAKELNQASFREGRLADDFPFLVSMGIEQIPDAARQRIAASSMETAVDMYASHPPIGERVARAKALDLSGSFSAVAPASLLFDDYPALCRAVTARYYEAALGDLHDPSCLVASAEVLGVNQTRQREWQRINEFFQGVVFGPSSLALEPLAPAAPPERAKERLQELRREVASCATEARRDEEGQDLELQVARTEAALELVTCNLAIRDPELATASMISARKSSDAAKAEYEASRERCGPLRAALRGRIALGLDLLCAAEVGERIDGAADLAERARRAVQCLSATRELSERIHELGRQHQVLRLMLPQIQGQDEEMVSRLLTSHTHRYWTHLSAVHAAARQHDYPYEHPRARFSLAEYLIDVMPAETALGDQMQVGAGALNAWSQVLVRLLGDVSTACLAVEDALQLEPLGVPLSPAIAQA